MHISLDRVSLRLSLSFKIRGKRGCPAAFNGTYSFPLASTIKVAPSNVCFSLNRVFSSEEKKKREKVFRGEVGKGEKKAAG